MGIPSVNERILYLFPDTNLFIQCRPLSDLPWSDLGEFDQIHLLLCRPVVREIDNQKNRGNDRLGHRARTAYKLFRNLISSHQTSWVITKGKPVVKLHLETLPLPNPELKDRLDYSKPDDELIGYLHRFQQDNQDKDIRLLTHDGGPMMTASSLNLSFIPIADDWLLQPENNETEREISRLKNRVIQLEKSEPQVELSCLDQQGEEIKALEVEFLVYSPITESDVAALIQLLRESFPQATDFGSREPAERQAPRVAASVLGAREVYIPASDEAIADYTNQRYPKWLSECEDIFGKLHITLQQDNQLPILSFVANNCGSRPARDVLLEIEAKGDVKVCVPAENEEQEVGKKVVVSLRLPSRPRPPHGRWKFTSPSLNLIGEGIPSIARALSREWQFPSLISRPELVLPPSSLDRRRDPNAFYYKPRRPRDPVESLSLECEQWRHGIEDQYFDVQVPFDPSQDRIEGAVECSIHAENLSAPQRLVIPIRVVVKRVEARTYANQLIENLQVQVSD